MNKKLVYAGLAIIGIILIIVVVVLVGGDSVNPDREKEIIASEKDPTSQSEDNISNLADFSPEQQLELYKKWAQYPPHSRPLFAGQTDRVKPFDASRPPVDVIAEPAKGCVKAELGLPRCETKAVFAPIKCQLTPESNVSYGTADFHVYLKCFKARDGKFENVALTIGNRRVFRKLFRKTYGTLPPVAFGDDGANGDKKADDKIYTFKLRPTASDWGYMNLEVDLEVEGFKHSHRATWFSTPHKVAEWLQGGRDEMKNGSLVVQKRIRVIKAGYYQFQANLQEKEGQQRMVATSSWEGDLKAGEQVVEFEFFGKIIRDKDVDGPYVVQNIRGQRNNSPLIPARDLNPARPDDIPEVKYTEPLWEYFPPAESYDTEVYKAADFSDAEWSAPEKTDRIKQLEKLASEPDSQQ